MGRHFDGTDDKIIVTKGNIPYNTDVTFSIWKKSDLAIAGNLFAAGDGNDFLTGWQIREDPDVGNSSLVFGKGSGGQYLQSDAWQGTEVMHIAGRANGTALEVFVDGVSVKTATFSGARQNPASDMRMGMRSDGFNYDGVLWEAAIWKTPLTDAQIASLARGVCPLVVDSENLVYYLPNWGVHDPEPNYGSDLNNGVITGAVKGTHHTTE